MLHNSISHPNQKHASDYKEYLVGNHDKDMDIEFRPEQDLDKRKRLRNPIARNHAHCQSHEFLPPHRPRQA